MEIFELLIFSFLIQLVLNLKESYLIEYIEYLKEYELNDSSFTDDRMELYFRLQIPSNKDNLGITFKAFTEEIEIEYLSSYYCLFNSMPTDTQIINYDKSYCNYLKDNYRRKYKTYTYFSMHLDKLDSGNYAVIYLTTDKKYKYFSVLVSDFHPITNALATKLSFNEKYVIGKSELSYLSTYFDFAVNTQNHDKNESIIINLSENDVNDLEIELSGKKKLFVHDSILIKEFENYTSLEKNGELITYKYNYGKISTEYNYLTVIIKSKDGYMLNYFSIQVGNSGNFISFGLKSVIFILSLLF